MTNLEIESTTSEEIENDVKDLAHNIDVYAKLGLMGAAIGSLVSLGIGPLGLISGTAIGAAVIGIQRLVADKKRQEIEKQILDFRNIDEKKAIELKKELDSIFSKTDETVPTTQSKYSQK